MKRISLVVITKNEEKNIEKCLASVPFASEIIVVDSGSSDRTGEIVKKMGGKFIYNEWPGYGKQKQFALNQASHDWVLSLDADEYLEQNLQIEMQKLLEHELEYDAYRVPRKQIFMGRECHYGKSVDHPVRFFNRKRGSFDEKNIHESFISQGKVGDFQEYMMHNSGITILDRCKKIMRDFELELIHNHDPHVSAKNIIIDPIRYFLSYFLKKKGYKDGLPGFIMTALFAFQMFLQNAGQFEKNLKKKISSRI